MAMQWSDSKFTCCEDKYVEDKVVIAHPFYCFIPGLQEVIFIFPWKRKCVTQLQIQTTTNLLEKVHAANLQAANEHSPFSLGWCR